MTSPSNRPAAGAISLVMLDLDGTLVEFPHDYLFSETDRILAELSHRPIERDILWEHFSDFDFFRFVEHPAPELFVERFWRAFDWANYPKGTPLPGIEEALAQLKQDGKKTAIATARLCTPAELRVDLAHTRLLEYIDSIATRDDPTIHWMDKSSHIRTLCEEFGVAPEECVLVGDVPADIASARAAGVRGAIAVRSGGIKDAVLLAAQPTILLDHLGDLPEVIRALEAGTLG